MTAEAGRQRQQQARERLGTGHGERESSHVGYTEFRRRGNRPDEVITIRYDSHRNLVAMGIIPRDAVNPRPPQPFPGAPDAGFTPDPPQR